MILQIVGAFIAVIAFSIVLEAPKKYLIYGGIVGGVGKIVYLLFNNKASVVLSSFFTALMIAFVSHVFARILKAPVTVFLIPGIMMLVPGTGMYRAVYAFLLESNSLAASYLQETISIAGMIALAILIMDSFFRLFPVNKIKTLVKKVKV